MKSVSSDLVYLDLVRSECGGSEGDWNNLAFGQLGMNEGTIRIESTIIGYIGTTIRIHSLNSKLYNIPSYIIIPSQPQAG